MNRKTALRFCLLNILMDFGDDVCPQETLHDHLNLRERPKVPKEDFTQLITELKEVGFIESLAGKFADDEPCWFITERGKVTLKQH